MLPYAAKVSATAASGVAEAPAGGLEADIFFDVASGNLKGVKKYLQQGGDPDQCTAASLVDLPFGPGGAPSLCTDAGDSLLTMATFTKQLDMVRLLVDHGASWTTPNANGDTPASIAAEVGFQYTCSPQQQRKEKREQKKRDSQTQKALKSMSAELGDVED